MGGVQGPTEALDAAALDALWDSLDRVDSHFWHVTGTSARLQSGAQAAKASIRPKSVLRGSLSQEGLSLTIQPVHMLEMTGETCRLKQNRQNAAMPSSD